MFARYLFVRLSICDNAPAICLNLGVSLLLRFGPQPAKVEDQMVDLILSRE